MKHKIALLFLPFLLTGCSYNPFQEYLNINVDVFASKLKILQCANKLVWEEVEDADGYEVYVRDSSTGKKELEKTTFSSHCDIPTSWYENSVQVIAYKINNGKNVKQAQTDWYEIVGSVPTTGSMNLSNNDVNSSYVNHNGTITISSYINVVYLSDINASGRRFEIESRQKGNDLYIYLENVTIDAKEVSSSGLYSATEYKSRSVFKYLGTNKDVALHFGIIGTNYITSGITSVDRDAVSAIDAPIVSFSYLRGDNANLTVVGGASGKNDNTKDDTSYAGYAVNCEILANYISRNHLYFVGGKGGKASSSSYHGGVGQLPFPSKAVIMSYYDYALTVKAGDGGKGYDQTSSYSTAYGGRGGNAYSYTYLKGTAYKKYARFLNSDLGSATPGQGGDGSKSGYQGNSGELITH